MTKLTKQQQKDNALKAYKAIVDTAYDAWKAYLAIADTAWEAYKAIVNPALEAYQAKLDEIDAQPDEVDEIITHNGRKYKLIGGSDELSNL